ncbi:hypothetical protein [Ottowia oryzae]
MPPAPPPPASPRIDVRSLSVSQLQQLSARGSRRARAELEGRMRAGEPAGPATRAPAPRAPAPVAHATRPGPVPGTTLPPAAEQGARPLAALSPATRVPPANPPTLTERASLNGLTPVPTPPPAPTPARVASGPLQGAAIPPRGAGDEGHAAVLDEALQMRMALIARQEGSGARTSGPPRLLGMALIAWAALLVFGGLVSLRHGSGVYYLFCGASAAAVGWLLMRCKRWAMPVHGVLVLIALGWAWRSQGSLGVALVQSAALWMPALWMTIRPVREGLD